MRRSRYQIISEILEICIGGSGITKIVYQANLNFKHVNLLVDLLTNNGLLSVKPGTKIKYETTDKGIKFLESFKKLSNELPEPRGLIRRIR